MKKRIALAVVIVLVGAVLTGCTIGNRKIGLDMTQTFRRFMLIAGDEVIEGTVTSWRDFENSDTVQFTDSNGVTYLTHYANVVLMTGR